MESPNLRYCACRNLILLYLIRVENWKQFKYKHPPAQTLNPHPIHCLYIPALYFYATTASKLNMKSQNSLQKHKLQQLKYFTVQAIDKPTLSWLNLIPRTAFDVLRRPLARNSVFYITFSATK